MTRHTVEQPPYIESQRKPLEEVAVGDRVWLGDSENRYDKIATVSYVAPLCISLQGRRDSYCLDGSVMSGKKYAASITCIATPAECEAWEKEQEAKRLAAKARREEQKAKQRELQSLFDSADIEEDLHRAGRWNITLNLPESDIHRIAECLKQESFK